MSYPGPRTDRSLRSKHERRLGRAVSTQNMTEGFQLIDSLGVHTQKGQTYILKKSNPQKVTQKAMSSNILI